MINYLMIWQDIKGFIFKNWSLVRVNEFEKLKLCLFIIEVVE